MYKVINLYSNIFIANFSTIFSVFHFITYIRVVQTVGPGPKFGPLTDFFWAL